MKSIEGIEKSEGTLAPSLLSYLSLLLRLALFQLLAQRLLTLGKLLAHMLLLGLEISLQHLLALAQALQQGLII